MGLDGRGQDDHVRDRPGSQQLVQGAEDSHGTGKPASLGRVGIGHGHQFQGAGFLEPGKVRQMPFAIAMNAYQGNARWGSCCWGAGCRGGGLLNHQRVLGG